MLFFFCWCSQVVANHLLTAALSSPMQHTGLCQNQGQQCHTVTARHGAIHKLSFASIANHARHHSLTPFKEIGTEWHLQTFVYSF